MSNSKTGRRGPYSKSPDRRRAIVLAAYDVFAARGYRGGSLQEVADRIGMSQTSLLHYFPSKSDLLLAVLNHRDALGVDGSEPPPDDSFSDRLIRQARHNEKTPGLIELYTVLCGEALTDDHPAFRYFSERFDRVRTEYTDELRALAARGKLREGVVPERAAASIIALWDGIQTQWLVAPGTIDMAACLRDLLDSFILPE
jgi:AcrR family transcriptional regulator